MEEKEEGLLGDDGIGDDGIGDDGIGDDGIGDDEIIDDGIVAYTEEGDEETATMESAQDEHPEITVVEDSTDDVGEEPLTTGAHAEVPVEDGIGDDGIHDDEIAAIAKEDELFEMEEKEEG